MEADVLSVREAAAQLNVSSQRVRQLIIAGSLPARRSSGGWLIRADAVARRSGSARAGRPASARTAWAALCLLSSALNHGPAGPAGCVIRDRRLRHHVVQLLCAMPDPVEDPEPWRLLLGSRGREERMWAHPGVLSNLARDAQVREGGDRAAAQVVEGLSKGPIRDLYVAESDVEELVARYRLQHDPDGQVRLHVVPESVPRELIPGPAGRVHPAVAIADLLDENDARARRSALIQLRAMVAALLSTDRHRIRSLTSPERAIDDGGADKAHGPGRAP
jgi:excisionase family DNA binding protein